MSANATVATRKRKPVSHTSDVVWNKSRTMSIRNGDSKNPANSETPIVRQRYLGKKGNAHDEHDEEKA